MNDRNLKPVRTKEAAKKLGKAGGIKSAQARREKKFLSQIYAEFLAKKYNVKIDKHRENLSGHEIISKAIVKILLRADHSSVALMREIREATEGTLVHVDYEENIDKMRESLIEQLKKLKEDNT